MTNGVSAVNAALTKWKSLEECLLSEVTSSDGMFGLDLVFNYIWVADSDAYEVRPNLDDEPMLVTLRLTAIESIRFSGGLSDAMRAEPESVGWGISEVALVEVEDLDPCVGVAVVWEGGRRRLDIVCSRVQLIEPTT